MADIQPEHGSTTIANELIRQVFMRGLLSKAQMQIVFTVISESWGWVDRKRSGGGVKVKHKTTRRPLRDKELSQLTGLHISDVGKLVRELIDAKVLRRHFFYYRFNKDYESWRLEEAKEARKKKRAAPGEGTAQKRKTDKKHGVNAPMIEQSEGTSQATLEDSNPQGDKVGREPLGNLPSETENGGEITYQENGDLLGDLPSKNQSTRENTYQAREIPHQPEETALGKSPSDAREIPYSWWGNSLMRWPSILRAARDSEPLNKKEININKLWSLYTREAAYWDKTKQNRYTIDELNEIFEYFQVVKQTRRSGKLAPSIIENEMERWEKYDKDIVLSSLRLHCALYAGKEEEYTRGIMRRAQKDRDRGNVPDVIAQYGTAAGSNDQHGGNAAKPALPSYARPVQTVRGPGITQQDFDSLGIGQ